jgi:hypothetical protein
MIESGAPSGIGKLTISRFCYCSSFVAIVNLALVYAGNLDGQDQQVRSAAFTPHSSGYVMQSEARQGQGLTRQPKILNESVLKDQSNLDELSKVR